MNIRVEWFSFFAIFENGHESDTAHSIKMLCQIPHMYSINIQSQTPHIKETCWVRLCIYSNWMRPVKHMLQYRYWSTCCSRKSHLKHVQWLWEYLYPSYGYHHIYCTLGWSNFHLFFDFRKRAHCNWLAIFLQKNSEFSTCACSSNFFIFKKSQETLKKNIFWGKFAETFILHEKTIDKNKIQT